MGDAEALQVRDLLDQPTEAARMATPDSGAREAADMQLVDDHVLGRHGSGSSPSQS
jgi:hypothetical protein